MEPDEYQQAWQAHTSQTRVTVDTDSLLKGVQRNQQELQAGISWGAFVVIGIMLLMLPVWIYMGVASASPWTWYLMVPALIWTIAFSLVVRARRKQRSNDPSKPLLSSAQESLALVEHQIWLNRNILWWYVLPMAIPLLANTAHVSWLKSRDWLDALSDVNAFVFVFLVALLYFIYWFNQRVVRTQYEPRRQELLMLLASLRDETTGEVSGKYPVLMSAERVKCSPRRLFVASLCFVVILLIVVAGMILAFSHSFASRHDPPEESPLAAVRGRQSQPEVKVGDESGETRTPESVPRTTGIRNAAQTRERGEQPQGMRRAVPIEDTELFRTRIDEFLNAARSKAGFSGAVLVARGGQRVYEGAFGFSHLESQAPNTLDTPFRIASLSKQFTAAAIFRLEGQGKLNMDDPVHQYLPKFSKQPYRDITIHHLLTHTSGLPRSPEGIPGSIRWNAMSKTATPVDDYVHLAAETPLEFAPGAEYQYSNFGYRVLAALIEHVTEREYADFMAEEIFQPLGMKDTGVARVTRPPSESRVAEGLSLLRLDPAGEPQFANLERGRNFGTGYGSGGLYSSANDLLRWDRVLAGDAFLSKSQKTRLFQPIHGNYACGWVVKKSGLDGRMYQMHNGANEGFFSQMMRLPADDLVIIAVGNTQATPEIDEVLEQLFRLCRSLPYQEL